MRCIKQVYLITDAPLCFSKLSGHEFLWYILLYRHFHNRQVEFISVPDKDDGCQEAVEERARSGGDELSYRAKSSNNPQSFRRSGTPRILTFRVGQRAATNYTTLFWIVYIKGWVILLETGT
jgi:hypothetical protein